MIKYVLIILLIILIFYKRSRYDETTTFDFTAFDGGGSGVKTDFETYNPTLYQDDAKIDYKQVTKEKEIPITGSTDLFNKQVKCNLPNEVLNNVEINPNSKKIKYKCVDIKNKSYIFLYTDTVYNDSSNVWVMNNKKIECNENPLHGFTITDSDGQKRALYNCATTYPTPSQDLCRPLSTPDVDKKDFFEGKKDIIFKTICDESEFLTQLEFDEREVGSSKGKIRLNYKCCSPTNVAMPDRSKLVRMMGDAKFTEKTLKHLGLITCNKKVKDRNFTYGSALNKLIIKNDPKTPNEFQARYNCTSGIMEASQYGKNAESKIDCGKHPITQLKFIDDKTVEYACNETEFNGSCEEKTTPKTNKISDHNVDCGSSATLSYLELIKSSDGYSFKYKCCDNVFKQDE